MENEKLTRFAALSTGFQPSSVIARFVQWIQQLATGNTSGLPTNQLQFIQQPIQNVPQTHHGAIIELMNKGKRFDDAELLVKTADEWHLNLDLFDTDNLSVSGQSVWIDLED